MAMWQKSFSCSQTQYMHFLDDICQEIVSGNLSASLEESSRFVEDNIIVQVDMFERYSFFGKNRVALSVTSIFKDDYIHITAMSSGGSQAVLMKINTVGEESFLNRYIQCVEDYFIGK